MKIKNCSNVWNSSFLNVVSLKFCHEWDNYFNGVLYDAIVNIRILFSDCYLKRLPQLEVAAGVKLFGVNAAVQYLHPVSSNDQSSVNQWLEWDVTQLQVDKIEKKNKTN